jgi:antitoxin PrlF
MQKQATLTSKGQVTVPLEVRKMLGLRSGDKLVFEGDEAGVRLRPVRSKSTFAKYRGIGNPGMRPGRAGIARWLRELRGE